MLEVNFSRLYTLSFVYSYTIFGIIISTSMFFESLNFADVIESGVACRPFCLAIGKIRFHKNDLYIALHQRELIIVIHNIKANYVLRVLKPFPLRYNAFKFFKIFRKSVDKKALRQGRHLMLLFPPPWIMLSKEETSRKIRNSAQILHFFRCYFIFS